MKKQSLIYYSSRVTQRMLLYMVVAATAIHWMILIVITGIVTFKSQLVGTEIRDPDALSDSIRTIVDTQQLIALRWAIIAAAATALLVLITRYRKYEKPLVADSLTLIVFCLLSVAFSEFLVRAFIGHLVG